MIEKAEHKTGQQSEQLHKSQSSTQETVVITKPLISKIGSISNSSAKLGTTKTATGFSRIGSVSNISAPKIKSNLNSIQIEDESNTDEQTPDTTTDS